MLEQYPDLRRIVYIVQWVINGIMGALGVYFLAQDDVPNWYTVAGAVLAFIWTYTGVQAQTNTPNKRVHAAGVKGEGGYVRDHGYLWLIVVVVVLLVLILLAVTGHLNF